MSLEELSNKFVKNYSVMFLGDDRVVIDLSDEEEE